MGGGGGQCQPWIDRAEWLFKKRFMENRTSTTQGIYAKSDPTWKNTLKPKAKMVVDVLHVP